jgi:hypothetical integral membrane protein (TIGR02206 family)
MAAADVWHGFTPYGWLHGVALIVCALAIVAPALLGRRLHKNAELVLRRTIAVFAVCYWLAYNIWWNWHGIDWRTGLPLQICDINGLIAPLALVTGQRWARATLYFWTAALTTQAFIQPALSAGPASLTFWSFWCAHTIIAACAVYDIVVLGFRPGWADFLRAFAVSLAYVAVVAPLDVWLGADYGYVGNPAPDIFVPPFVVALGPWPQRAIILAALVAFGLFAVLVPWLFAARRPARARTAAPRR